MSGGQVSVVLQMLPGRVHITFQHNYRWLYSIKLVGYRKQMKSALWCTHNRREERCTLQINECNRVSQYTPYSALPTPPNNALTIEGSSSDEGGVGGVEAGAHHTALKY